MTEQCDPDPGQKAFLSDSQGGSGFGNEPGHRRRLTESLPLMGVRAVFMGVLPRLPVLG